MQVSSWLPKELFPKLNDIVGSICQLLQKAETRDGVLSEAKKFDPKVFAAVKKIAQVTPKGKK